jgi:hypothetical protein
MRTDVAKAALFFTKSITLDMLAICVAEPLCTRVTARSFGFTASPDIRRSLCSRTSLESIAVSLRFHLYATLQSSIDIPKQSTDATAGLYTELLIATDESAFCEVRKCLAQFLGEMEGAQTSLFLSLDHADDCGMIIRSYPIIEEQ